MISRRGLVISLILATIVQSPAGGQPSADSIEVVEVLGSPTRVMTLGLDRRRLGEPVLVLQAGAGGRIESWGPLIPAISDIAPLVAYDRPGLGESPFDGIDPTPRRVTAHLQALLTAIDVPPPYVLVGHSWGGPLILHYAGRYPQEVVGMVYIDPTPPWQTWDDFFMTSDEAERVEMQVEWDSLRATVPPGPPERQAETRVIDGFWETPLEERDLLEKPRAPTAIVLGTLFVDRGLRFYDEPFQEAVNQNRIRRFRAWIRDLPEATLVAAPHLGHSAHRDDPDLVAEVIRRVVDAVDSRPPGL